VAPLFGCHRVRHLGAPESRGAPLRGAARRRARPVRADSRRRRPARRHEPRLAGAQQRAPRGGDRRLHRAPDRGVRGGGRARAHHVPAAGAARRVLRRRRHRAAGAARVGCGRLGSPRVGSNPGSGTDDAVGGRVPAGGLQSVRAGRAIRQHHGAWDVGAAVARGPRTRVAVARTAHVAAFGCAARAVS